MGIKQKIICILLIFVCFSLKSQQFNGGVLGGVSASQITGDELSGFNKAGLYLGSFVNFYLNRRTSIQMEIDYIQKGSRKNPNPDNNDFITYKLNLNLLVKN